MALFVITLALVGLFAVLFALPLLRLAKQTLPIGASPLSTNQGHEVDGGLTDRKVEELIREELYGQRLNVSRR